MHLSYLTIKISVFVSPCIERLAKTHHFGVKLHTANNEHRSHNNNVFAILSNHMGTSFL